MSMGGKCQRSFDRITGCVAAKGVYLSLRHPDVSKVGRY